jgi:hypothetical protein
MWLELRTNLTLGLLQTKHLTNGDQWKGNVEMETNYFWRYLYVISRPSSRVLRDPTQAVKVKCILLSKEQYTIRRQRQVCIP